MIKIKCALGFAICGAVCLAKIYIVAQDRIAASKKPSFAESTILGPVEVKFAAEDRFRFSRRSSFEIGNDWCVILSSPDSSESGRQRNSATIRMKQELAVKLDGHAETLFEIDTAADQKKLEAFRALLDAGTPAIPYLVKYLWSASGISASVRDQVFPRILSTTLSRDELHRLLYTKRSLALICISKILGQEQYIISASTPDVFSCPLLEAFIRSSRRSTELDDRIELTQTISEIVALVRWNRECLVCNGNDKFGVAGWIDVPLNELPSK